MKKTRRQKSHDTVPLSVHEDNGYFRVVLFTRKCLQSAKSILACTENTLKAYKRIRRIRRESIAVYGEYADS
jgi:hypothetical protein